jgi:hypothetical protein
LYRFDGFNGFGGFDGFENGFNGAESEKVMALGWIPVSSRHYIMTLGTIGLSVTRSIHKAKWMCLQTVLFDGDILSAQ